MSNDIKAIVNAETHGQTLLQAEQDSPIKQQIRQFAQSILASKGGVSVAREAAPALQVPRKPLLTFLKKNG